MKRQIIFNLDEDLVEELKKQGNRSKFLNDLLRDTIGKGRLLNMSKEELLELRDRVKKKEELEAKIKELGF